MAIRTLRTLVEGRLPPDSGLLESARLSGLGAEVFGQEAIVAEFARVGRLLSDGAEYLQSEGGLLALDGTRAIVADLYFQRLARLWWVGMPAIAATAPHSIAVPFDPDLAQVRGSVLFSPADHPDLTLLHAQHVPAVVRAALPWPTTGPSRCLTNLRFAVERTSGAPFLRVSVQRYSVQSSNGQMLRPAA